MVCILKVLANVNMTNCCFQLWGLRYISVTVARTTVVTTAHDLHLDETFRILQNFDSLDTNISEQTKEFFWHRHLLPLLHPVLHLHELSSMIDSDARRFVVNIGCHTLWASSHFQSKSHWSGRFGEAMCDYFHCKLVKCALWIPCSNAFIVGGSCIASV